MIAEGKLTSYPRGSPEAQMQKPAAPMPTSTPSLLASDTPANEKSSVLQLRICAKSLGMMWRERR